MESKALDRIAKRLVLQVFALSRSAAGGVGCSTETGSDAGKVSLSFVARVLLVHALALVARANVSIRLAFHLRNHFEFSDYAPSR